MKKYSLAIISLLLSQQVMAAEWVIDGSANPSFGYDDNELLLQKPKGDFSLKVTPTLSLSRAEENAKTKLNVGYNISRYDRLTQLNAQNPFANFNTTYNTERSEYGLGLDYSKRQARSIAETDTGDFSSNSTVTTKSITPSFNYNLTARDKILTSLGYSKQKNEGGSTSNASDNRSKQVNIAWQHAFSERWNGGISGAYTNFHADTTTSTNKYDSYQLSLTSTYALSPIWQLNGQAGMRILKSNISPIIGSSLSSRTNGTTFSFGATRKGEVSDFNATVARAIIPSSIGQVNQQTSYNLSYDRHLTERVVASLTAGYREFKNADNLSSSDVKYAEIAPSIKWNLQENLYLNFRYKYRHLKRSGSYSTHSNGFFVSVNYDWDGIRFSR